MIAKRKNYKQKKLILSDVVEEEDHLCIAIGNQSYRHDVFQNEPSGEEHLGEEKSAAGTQTLIVEFNLDWICCLTGPQKIRFQALLYNLQMVAENYSQVQFVTRPELQFKSYASNKLPKLYLI